MLNDKDVAFLSQKNITAEQVEQQLLQFNIGIQRLEIVKPVTHRDGIRQLNEKRLNECVKLFEKKSKKLSKTKFVPASGAATRMFRSLYEILNTYKGSEEDYLKDFGFRAGAGGLGVLRGSRSSKGGHLA